MATYLFTYRVAKTPLREVLAELDETARAERLSAWNDWFESMEASVIERGQPVADAHDIGNCGSDTRIGGYSLVTADNLEEALRKAKGCPGLAWGGGVEVGELTELPVPNPKPEVSARV
jgi:hypothetical protein